MVVPPALMAATPVGATITVAFGDVSLMCLRKVVLPVPAFPVRKSERDVLRTNSSANVKTMFSLATTLH